MSNGKNHTPQCTCGFCRNARRAKAGTISRRSHACAAVSQTSVLRAPVIGDLDRKPSAGDLFNAASCAARDMFDRGEISRAQLEAEQAMAWTMRLRVESGAGVPA